MSTTNNNQGTSNNDTPTALGSGGVGDDGLGANTLQQQQPSSSSSQHTSNKSSQQQQQQYYDTMKSKLTLLLSTTTSTSSRENALEILVELCSTIDDENNNSGNNLRRSRGEEDATTNVVESSSSNSSSHHNESNSHKEHILSTILPLLTKMMVSNNGTASTMMMNSNNNNALGGAKNGGGGGGGGGKDNSSNKGNKKSAGGGGGGGKKKRKKDKLSSSTVGDGDGGTSCTMGDNNNDNDITSSSNKKKKMKKNTNDKEEDDDMMIIEETLHPKKTSSAKTKANVPSSSSLPLESPTPKITTSFSQTKQPTSTSSSSSPKITRVMKTNSPCYISPSNNTFTINYKLRFQALILLDKLCNLLLLLLPNSGSTLSTKTSSNTATSTAITSATTNSTAAIGNNYSRLIITIVIHTIIDDYEENSLLAHSILVKLLRGKVVRHCTPSSTAATSGKSIANVGNSGSSGSGSGSGEHLTKGQIREYQALFDFTVEMYKTLSGKGELVKRFELVDSDGAGGTNTFTPRKKKSSTTDTLSAEVAAEGGKEDDSPSQSPTTNNNNDNIQSSQSYKLLSELPTTILHLFTLYPTKFIKNNLARIIVVIMDMLKLVPPSPPLPPPSSGGGSSTAVSSSPNVTTPSLSTPKIIHTSSKGGGKGNNKSSLEETPRSISSNNANANNEEQQQQHQRKLQHYQMTLVAFISSQIKSLSFFVNLLRTISASTSVSSSSLASNKKTVLPPPPPLSFFINNNIIDNTLLETVFKPYEEILGTFVIQLLRCTSSSSFIIGTSSSSTSGSGSAGGGSSQYQQQQQQLSSIAIQLRKELLVNTRYLLLSSSIPTSTTSSSSGGKSSSNNSTSTTINFRRGFYRHVDTMLDERTLIGSSRSLGGSSSSSRGCIIGIGGGFLGSGGGGASDGIHNQYINWEYELGLLSNHHSSSATTTSSYWGGASPTQSNNSSSSNSSSAMPLQPMGYTILAEFISQIRTKLTLAQMSRTIRIFARVLHCDLPFVTIHQNQEQQQEGEGGGSSSSRLQLLPNFTTPYSNIQITAAKLLITFPEIIFHKSSSDPNPQVGRDLLHRTLQTAVHKLDVISGYVPIILNVVEKEMKERVMRYQKQQQGGSGSDDTTTNYDPFTTTNGNNDTTTDISSSILTIVLNLQHLVRPIINGMKALFWCISTYSHQYEKERQRSIMAGEEQFPYPTNNNNNATSSSDNDRSSRGGGGPAGDESVHSGLMKVTIGERELMERFIRVGLTCCRLFSINVGELEKLWLEMDDGIVVGNVDQSSYSSSSMSSITASSVRGKKSAAFHRRHREILESFAVSFTSLESHNFRKLMSSSNIHYMVQQVDEYDDSNVIHVFSHLLLTTGKAVSHEFVTVVVGYLMEHGVQALGVYENPKAAGKPQQREESNDNKEGVTISLSSSSSQRPFERTPAVLTKHSQNLSKLYNLVFASMLKYPRNESILLPHLQKMIKEFVQRAMMEGPPGSEEGGFSELVWPGPYLNLLRVLFRTISGGKFDASFKEILPLIPTILNSFYGIYTSTYAPSPSSPSFSTVSSSLHHTIIEICLTIPSRLATLLPHLPLLFLMIINALQSKQGHLINTGLRTLEFWMDNLHGDYLLGVLTSMDTTASSGVDTDAENSGSTLNNLMAALTQHLQPAPYPYGLLCMRLLGKMGGMNRLFLREIVAVGGGGRLVNTANNLTLSCEWLNDDNTADEERNEGGVNGTTFLLTLPLNRAVNVLRRVAASPRIVVAGGAEASTPAKNPYYQGKNFSDLSSIDPRSFDLNFYTAELMEETKRDQSRSAFVVLRAALTSIIDIDGGDGSGNRDAMISICTKNGVVQGADETITNEQAEEEEEGLEDALPNGERHQQNNTDFRLICDGLYAASVHKDLNKEAITLLKGLGSHIVYFILSHRANITRIDRDGHAIDPYFKENESEEVSDSQSHLAESKSQLMKPFGCFRLRERGQNDQLDPFVFNEALAEAFTNKDVTCTQVVASEVMDHVLALFRNIKGQVVYEDVKVDDTTDDVEMKDADRAATTTWGDILFENLLSKLCQILLSSPWNLRTGAMTGLFSLITKMGHEWAQQYEVEIIHTAMFVVKDTPDNNAHASKESIRFYLQVSWFFFGGPDWRDELVQDVLCPMLSNTKPNDEENASGPSGDDSDTPTSSTRFQASLTLILSEITSTKPLVRFAVRHTLRMITRDSASIDALLANHTSTLKRLLFPKALRVLPLPNQCAVIDACALILTRAPKLFSIADKSLLGLLSELLKMISIADGVLSDPGFGSVVLIDKDGYAVNSDGAPSHHRSTVQPSSLFLRKSIIIEDESVGGRIQVPAELPFGIQLRVSTLLLFKGLIRGISDEFYDADSKSTVGNIRPHVVALLFRSLISDPPEVCAAATSSLHTALTLCVPSKEPEDGSASSKGHRLPKDLIQSCIKPILLNLRDYKNLSIPLLRGLSRLLNLLPSWFNKSLGEKLIEHLKKFCEPDKIMQSQVFKPGDEPLKIAALTIEIFSSLPHASNFVEALVRRTLDLESVMYKYKCSLSTSPFRKPLAKYLNRYYAGAVGFFLEEHRLCNPVFSNLFQDMLKRDDTTMLRNHLSANSAMLLHVCFDRPIAIIRSEKSSASEGKPSSLAVYGINEWSSPLAQRKLEVARQDIDMKKKFLALKSSSLAKASESNASDQAKVKADSDAVDHARRDLDQARNAYARMVSQANEQQRIMHDKPMTASSLELQHQGFKIVEILSSLDPNYLESQKNDVVRALRWLWRSRGRHYRLLHEEEGPPRYHFESFDLGNFLTRFSRANPTDTDVLFDLLRIFIQPLSSIDFSFVKQFLMRTVCNFSIEQKSLTLKRFSTLLQQPSQQETKIISASALVIPMLEVKEGTGDIFHDSVSGKLLIESLLKDTSNYGTKLTCEILNIIDILLSKMKPEDMTEYRKELLKYIWAVLKKNDAATKFHAYLAVSRFIAAFDTPSKVVHQVVKGLYRCGHNMSERNIIRTAMDVLLPALGKRLDIEDLETALQYALKLMHEGEGTAVQQILFWESVELTKLSVDLAKLSMDWGIAGVSQHEVDAFVNALICHAFAITTCRQDQQRRIRSQILSLLEDILLSKKNCKIKSAPFDNVLSRNDKSRGKEEESKGKKSTRKESHDSLGDHEGADKVLLCAEVTLCLLRRDPTNEFLGWHACSIVNESMTIVTSSCNNSKLSKVLEDVLIHLLLDEKTSIETTSSVVVMLENALRRTGSTLNHSAAYFVISVIEKVGGKNRDLIEPFVGSLSVFAEMAAKNHIQELAGRASNLSFIESEHQHQLSATQTLGVFEEACNMGFKSSSSQDDIVQARNAGFNNQLVVDNGIVSTSLKSLISSLRLLSSTNLLHDFSSARSAMVKILNVILDSSNSLPLLLSAVSIVGNWLLSEQPLTKTEHERFLCQLASLDLQRSGLSETPSQALADLVCCIVLQMFASDASTVHKMTMQKQLVSCLLSANPHIRALSMDVISAQGNDCNRDLSHIISQALHLDYEELGKRLWTTVIVDILLASCKNDGGVCPGHGLRFNHEKSQLKEHGAVEVSTEANDNDGVYSSFKKVLWADREIGGHCIAAIRHLVHGDVETCQSMLNLSFQSAWTSLSNSSRASLIVPVERLLAQPFHSPSVQTRQCSQINAVQSMLRCLTSLHPMPMLDPFLLQSLAVNYNVSSEALFILESQYLALKANGYTLPQDLMKAIHRIYESLEDHDTSIAISSGMSSLAGTKYALSLAMYDCVNESSDAFLSLIDGADGNLPTECEMAVWEAQWIESQREMSQWAVLDDFASSTQDTSLMLECAWKTNNWDKVKSLCTLSPIEASDPVKKITDIHLAIHEGKYGHVEVKHAQSAQLYLKKWNMLPLVGAERNKEKCLQQFQRLVELRETSQIMADTSSHLLKRTVPDLKLLLTAWRHRLPNTNEPVRVWNDLFQCRFKLFDSIATDFSWTNASTIASLHDSPFTCISIGRTARKHGLKDVAASSLDCLQGELEVDLAFLKLREQVLNMDLQSSLALVNSVNLSCFENRQKAEIFRLKAKKYEELGAEKAKSKSHHAYCHAVQISPNYARAWIDWGHLCASLDEIPKQQSGKDKEDAEIRESAKQRGLYLVQAMGCFLEAIRCDPNEKSRDQIPYCLSMLASDGSSFGNICRAFETRSAALPSWVWLPWIPQLLSSLCRVEARAMKAVIIGITKDHPQALYYALRSFYLERRDVERLKGQKVTESTTDGEKDDDKSSSSRLAEEFFAKIRKAHLVLWGKLESILEDLIVRFRPSYEAELLHSLVALLQKALSGQLDACTKTLSILGTKFFNPNREAHDRKTALFRSKYASLFKSDFLEKEGGADMIAKLKKWKAMLEREISRVPRTFNLYEVSPPLSSFSSQAPELWAGACESQSLALSNALHDAHTPLDNTLYRASRSSVLAAAKASSQGLSVAARAEGLGGHCGGGAAKIEIPGQYAPTSSSALDSRPFPELHAKLVRFHQTVELASTNSSSTNQHVHQITMIGSDGKKYKFLLQAYKLPISMRTDERAAQLNYVLGKTLRRDARSSRRFLNSSSRVVIPVSQRMKMCAVEPSHKSLDSVSSHVQGAGKSKLASYFEEKVEEITASRLGTLEGNEEDKKNQVTRDAKLEVYHEICQKLAPPNVLSRYMMETIPSTERLFQFRRTFASQLAANSLLQYALSIQLRTPSRFLFCESTGRILSQDFRSQYTLPNGLLDNLDMPFRLTRNITEFIGPFLLEGVFVPSFANVSSALHSSQNVLEHILYLLLRDDVMAWYISKSSNRSDQKIQEVEHQLIEKIWSNVKFAQGRFEECSPREVKDAAAEAINPSPTPIDIKVRTLVDASMSAEKLCMMPPSYEAWL